MVFGTPYRLKSFPPLNIQVDNDTIEQVTSFKYLGITLDSTLSFVQHIECISRKINSRISILGRTSSYLSKRLCLLLYKSLIVPHFDYCDIVWDTCSSHLKHRLQTLQNRALRIINKVNRRTPISDLHKLSNILTLQQRRDYHMSTFMYKATHGLQPAYICEKFLPLNNIHSYTTRSASTNSVHISYVKTNGGKNRISYRGAVDWNNLLPEIRMAPTLSLFKILNGL